MQLNKITYAIYVIYGRFRDPAVQYYDQSQEYRESLYVP